MNTTARAEDRAQQTRDVHRARLHSSVAKARLVATPALHKTNDLCEKRITLAADCGALSRRGAALIS